MTQAIFVMFVRKKKSRSGTTSVIVAEKQGGRFRELITIGVSSDESEVAELVRKGKEWIDREQERRHPRLDLLGDERRACEDELAVLFTFVSAGHLYDETIHYDVLLRSKSFDFIFLIHRVLPPRTNS